MVAALVQGPFGELGTLQKAAHVLSPCSPSLSSGHKVRSQHVLGTHCLLKEFLFWSCMIWGDQNMILNWVQLSVWAPSYQRVGLDLWAGGAGPAAGHVAEMSTQQCLIEVGGELLKMPRNNMKKGNQSLRRGTLERIHYVWSAHPPLGRAWWTMVTESLESTLGGGVGLRKALADSWCDLSWGQGRPVRSM